MPEQENPVVSRTQSNWLDERAKLPLLRAFEVKLYSDATIYGEVPALGPYELINTIAHARADLERLRPALVLRINVHGDAAAERMPLIGEPEAEHYHGGDFADELAALLSLRLGVRFKAGPIERELFPGQDPRGRPIEFSDKLSPNLSHGRATQLPRMRDGVNVVDAVGGLRGFWSLTAGAANCVIKAARLYQEGVWIADADPAMAWLLLVSAVEAAAQHDAFADSSLPTRDVLDHWHAGLGAALATDPSLGDAVAAKVRKLTAATRKFRSFMQRFGTEVPGVRPLEYERFPPAKVSFKKALETVYEHRSNALHGGIAIPYPMCIPPRINGAAIQEIPHGFKISARNATWRLEDTPMLLNHFEFLARTALTKWWDQLPTVGANTLGADA